MPQARQTVGPYAVLPGLNTTGSTIPKNRIVIKTTGAVDGVGIASGGTVRLEGVAMQEILAGRAGDIQVKDTVTVEASAAIAIGAKVTSAAAGKAVTAGAAVNILGIARSAAAADGDLIEVEIDREVTAA